MNETQRKILIAMAAIVAAMVLFPPYLAEFKGRVIAAGYGFLFALPDKPFPATVNAKTLFTQIAGVLIVGSLLFMTRKQSDQTGTVAVVVERAYVLIVAETSISAPVAERGRLRSVVEKCATIARSTKGCEAIAENCYLLDTRTAASAFANIVQTLQGAELKYKTVSLQDRPMFASQSSASSLS